MLVIVSLHLKSAQEPTDTRQKFWSEYAKLSGLAAITPEQGEAKIKQTFLQLLSSQINSEIRRSRLRVRSRLRDKLTSFIRYGHLWVTHRRITIELIAIQYGSIEFVMNILGLDSETMREKALDILALYSPVAFNQSLGETATSTADFDSPISQKRAVAPLAVLGSSLLVPLILALAVCYVAFNALMDELKGIRAERLATKTEQADELKGIRAERLATKTEQADWLRAITDQNTKLSASMVDTTKAAHAALRNAMMRSMSAEDFYNNLQWLYGGSGLAEGISAIV